MNFFFYGFAILVFFSITLMIESGYLWWRSHHSNAAKRFGNRIRTIGAEGTAGQHAVSILKERTLSASPLVDRALQRIPHIQALDGRLVQSGLDWSVERFILYTICPPVIVFCVGSLFHVPMLLLIALMLFSAAAAPFRVSRAREKRLAKIEEQLPEAADMLSRTLKAGHSFTTALGIVGDEMPDPIGREFRIVFDQTSFGVPLGDALGDLAARVPLADLRYFVIAVLIQRESGGNLAEILGGIAQIVRSRLALLGKVRALSAEGRLSAWILGLMPFGLGGLMSIINPEVLPVLWNDPAGQKMVEGSLVAMMFGFVWMRRIIRIHV